MVTYSGCRHVTYEIWTLTLDGKKGLVDVPGEQGLGQLPEELLEDGGHVVDAHLVRQDHVNTAVKILPELE